MTPEALYLQLGHLVAEMPTFTHPAPVEQLRWLGRAAALLEQGDPINYGTFLAARDNLIGGGPGFHGPQIGVCVYAALARAELAAPVSAQGAFIPAGATFDAFAAVGKVLGPAKFDILFVDPYADEKLLTDFAIQAPEGVSVRILAGRDFVKPTLRPAAERWSEQHGATRPLDVRLDAPRALHDRMIQVDHSTVFTVGQSFNALAARAPSSLVRADAETAQMKVDAYDEMWRAAAPI